MTRKYEVFDHPRYGGISVVASSHGKVSVHSSACGWHVVVSKDELEQLRKGEAVERFERPAVEVP